MAFSKLEAVTIPYPVPPCKYHNHVDNKIRTTLGCPDFLFEI
jgi:hypothetical protein